MNREIFITALVWGTLTTAALAQESGAESRYLKALELCRTNNQTTHAALVDFDSAAIEFDQPTPKFVKLEQFAIHASGDLGRTADTRIYMDKRSTLTESLANLPTNLGGTPVQSQAVDGFTFIGQHSNRWYFGTWGQDTPSNVKDWTDRSAGDAEFEKYLKMEFDRYKFEAFALPFLDWSSIAAKQCTMDRVLAVQKLKKVAYSSESESELTITFTAGGEAIDRYVLSAKHNFLPVQHEFFLRKRLDVKLSPQSDHGKLITRTKTHWESRPYKDASGKESARWVPARFELERFGGRYVNVEALCAWDYDLNAKTIGSAAIIGSQDHSLRVVYEKLREQIDKRIATAAKKKQVAK